MTINNCLKHAPPEGMGSKHWALGKNANKITIKNKKSSNELQCQQWQKYMYVCVYVYGSRKNRLEQACLNKKLTTLSLIGEHAKVLRKTKKKYEKNN